MTSLWRHWKVTRHFKSTLFERSNKYLSIAVLIRSVSFIEPKLWSLEHGWLLLKMCPRETVSGRWQAPAAVLPMAQRQLTEGPRTKGTATRGPEGPESGKNMRARGPEGPEDELSWVPVLGACQCYYMFFTIQPKIAIFMAQFKYLNDGQNASKF